MGPGGGEEQDERCERAAERLGLSALGERTCGGAITPAAAGARSPSSGAASGAAAVP